MAGQPTLTQFDVWMELAARDPEAFEALRRQCIEEAIARAPADRQERLRGLQWRIEQTRRRAESPMGACVALSRMMWDSVFGERGLLETLQSFPRRPALPLARVVEFPTDRPR